MTVKPKYCFNLDGNISDGEKEYSLENIEDKISGLSISSDLKDNHVLYGRNSLLDLINNLNDENEQLKFQLDECRNHKLFSRRELEKENEQLKKENKWLKSIHFANDVLKENKLLKEKLNEILELTELTGMIHLRKAEIKSIIKR